MNLSPSTELFAITRLKTPSGTLFSERIPLMTLCTATAVRGVLELGFQTTTLPAVTASIVFHAHTAIGKLNDVTMPTIPSG